MGDKTKIEWADSTLNLEMGCDGCELWNPKVGETHCYAGTLTDRYAGRQGWPEAFEKPQLFLDRIKQLERWPDLRGTKRPDKPWLDGMPRLVFMCDMGDPWTELLPIDWLEPHIGRLAAVPHTLIWMTKRPHRARELFERYPAPENFWLLTSVTSEAMSNRIAELLSIPGLSMRGVSLEPLLGPVDLMQYLTCDVCEISDSAFSEGDVGKQHSCLDWIVCGGESGPEARPMHPDWPRSVRDQCIAADTPFFFKQHGEWLHYSHLTDQITDSLRGAPQIHTGPDGTPFFRVGKKAAGRLLDGEEWSEFPDAQWRGTTCEGWEYKFRYRRI